MSLIQEALKRQQAEFGDGVPPGASSRTPDAPATEPVPAADARPAAEYPPAPATRLSLRKSVPAPEASPDETPVDPAPGEITRRPWLGMLGVVLAVLFILALVIGLLLLAWRHFLSEGDAGPAAKPAGSPEPAALASVPAKVAPPPVDVPADAAPGPAGTAPAAAAPAASEAAQEVVVETATPAVPAPESASAPVSAAESPVPAPVMPPPPAAALDVAAPAPEAPAAPAEVAASPAPPAIWPRLNLSGVLCSAVPGEGAARINNTMVFDGGDIEGATLLKIQEDGVLLRYQGETRFLRVGATLY